MIEHEQRVTELLQANNAEVERRRAAERERDLARILLRIALREVSELRGGITEGEK